jgi:hypothetical protein
VHPEHLARPVATATISTELLLQDTAFLAQAIDDRVLLTGHPEFRE